MRVRARGRVYVDLLTRTHLVLLSLLARSASMPVVCVSAIETVYACEVLVVAICHADVHRRACDAHPCARVREHADMHVICHRTRTDANARLCQCRAIAVAAVMRACVQMKALLACVLARA